MGKKKTKEQSVWQQRKTTLFYLIILVIVIMVMVMSVRSIISYVETNNTFSSEEEQGVYKNNYNASRFFFRLYYPDQWQVNADTNGFMLDDTKNLVLELYPLVQVLHTNEPTSSPDSDAAANMVRDTSLTASFYYYAYNEEQQQWMAEHPSDGPVLSDDLTEVESKTDLDLLDKITRDVYASMVSTYDAQQYTFKEEFSNYETKDITFRFFTYQLKQAEGTYDADVYVAVRASNYYVIVYEGLHTEEENAYGTHQRVFKSMLEGFRFSVFED